VLKRARIWRRRLEACFMMQREHAIIIIIIIIIVIISFLLSLLCRNNISCSKKQEAGKSCIKHKKAERHALRTRTLVGALVGEGARVGLCFSVTVHTC
jgi:hypothetical protein